MNFILFLIFCLKERSKHWTSYDVSVHIAMHRLVCEACRVTLPCATNLIHTWFDNTKSKCNRMRRDAIKAEAGLETGKPAPVSTSSPTTTSGPGLAAKQARRVAGGNAPRKTFGPSVGARATKIKATKATKSAGTKPSEKEVMRTLTAGAKAGAHDERGARQQAKGSGKKLKTAETAAKESDAKKTGSKESAAKKTGSKESDAKKTGSKERAETGNEMVDVPTWMKGEQMMIQSEDKEYHIVGYMVEPHPNLSKFKFDGELVFGYQHVQCFRVGWPESSTKVGMRITMLTLAASAFDIYIFFVHMAAYVEQEKEERNDESLDYRGLRAGDHGRFQARGASQVQYVRFYARFMHESCTALSCTMYAQCIYSCTIYFHVFTQGHSPERLP